MKILIAEDNESSRVLLEALLAAEGYEVVAFQNGIKALAYLQTQIVDLIVSDILMPEMDGYGLCRAVKQNHTWQISLLFFIPPLIPHHKMSVLQSRWVLQNS